MVLLTMTASIVEALQLAADTPDKLTNGDTPSLADPAIGKPISHTQIIELRNSLQPPVTERFPLETLLRGAAVYVPPPPPKAEPVRSCSPPLLPYKPQHQLTLSAPSQTAEYKALMARLRVEQEEREYERLTQKNNSTREMFAQRFPGAPMDMAHAFAETNRPFRADDIDGDEFEFGDVQRQVTLIFNFLLSIIGVGAALWMLAKWWPTPARLFLAMGGSIVVAIAEVVVYSIFNWRMKEGSKREDRKKEQKEIMNTWVVGGPKEDVPALEAELLAGAGKKATGVDHGVTVRKRVKEAADHD